MTAEERYFADDRHAAYAGWVLGVARNNGVMLEPVYDEHGNYLNRFTLELAAPKERPATFTVTFVIPYPPEDWMMDDG